MEFGNNRLEGLARVKEYPPEHASGERKRRAPRSRHNDSLAEEAELGGAEDNESHQLDDVG